MSTEGVGVSQRVAKVTIAKWLKRISEQTIQKFAAFKAMEQKGRIERNCHGGKLVWPFRYKDHQISTYVDMGLKEFSTHDGLEDATLPWGAYDVKDAISLMEKAQNGGEEAMVQILNSKEEDMRKAATKQFNQELYSTGATTGRLKGLDSCCSVTGQSATDEFATTPNATYAGISTAYDTYHASDYSQGYKVWSPILPNCNRTVDGATQAWADFADEYIRKAILAASYGQDESENTDMILLRKASFEALLNICDDKERITVSRGANLAMVKLGFKNFVEIDGVPTGWDFGIPATDVNSNVLHGFGLNTDQLKLCVLEEGKKKTKGLWRAKVTWSTAQGATLIYMYLFCQLRIESPRHVIKFAELS